MAAPVVTPQRIQRFIKSRFNPIRSLTPEWLSQMIDSFDAGFLREFALMSDAIERRDDILASVAPKRKKAIARNGYEIVTTEKSATADEHKKTLEHFYGHLTAVNAISENERGGFKLLVRQMADAIGKKFAVHEIVWKPTPKGLTADFRFVPLWFFENRLGRLRYLPQEGAIDGIDLEPDNWMITVGDGLMLPCAIAYMFKHLPLKDWLVYCERFGMPIPIGETNAAKDSPEWEAMVAAVESIMAGAAAVKNTGENITLLETKGVGEVPHAPLVERMDRAMSAMWRGSDLSTMSRGGKGQQGSVGASVQGEESEILEIDDTEMISETLNIQVTRPVIRYAHGDDEPLAYIKVMTTRRIDVQNEIRVDEFLCSNGFPLDLQSVSERYGRPIPKGVTPTELLKPAASGAGDVTDPAATRIPPENAVRLANAVLNSVKKKMITDAAQIFGEARKRDLAQVATRLHSIFALSDFEQDIHLKGLRHELPVIAKNAMKNPHGAPLLADLMSAEFFNGIDDANKERQPA
jgi:phage gp29-like protein